MSAQRIEKFNRALSELGDLVIDSEALTGWPGFAEIAGGDRPIKVALHISTVSPHARRDHEVRFQNPATASAVSSLGGTGHPILLASDSTGGATVFVAIDGTSRLGRLTRFSILFNRRIIEEARQKGWSVYESRSGEKVYAFLPMLFPAFLEQITSGEILSTQDLTQVASASGAVDHGGTAAADRASRAVNVLIRKSGAGRAIRAAYNHMCCMCQIGSGLVVGAHIFPVEATGSTDNVWNGLSLCHNHHAAFDQHLIWVHPESRMIVLHPSLHQEAMASAGTRHFVDSTQPRLASPARPQHNPRSEMFRQRYDYFSGKYLWV